MKLYIDELIRFDLFIACIEAAKYDYIIDLFLLNLAYANLANYATAIIVRTEERTRVRPS